MPDLLDHGSPKGKRWEEFRAQYASALLLHWVYKDLAATASEAVADLWSRLWSSIDSYPDLLRTAAAQEGSEWDGEVPFHGPDGDIAFWASLDDIEDLEQSLFPHRQRQSHLDSPIRSAIVVSMHTALEAYSVALGLDLRKGLPSAIKAHLDTSGTPLTATIFDALVDCDATRHIIIHNRGVVDSKYIRQVRNPQYLEGEFRAVTDDVIDRFAQAIQSVARSLHSNDT